MNNNIKILLVNCNELEDVLHSFNYQHISIVKNGKSAIKEFVGEHYDVTFIHELPAEEERALIASMLEINPDHYIVILADDINAEKVLQAVQSGARGILNKPFTAPKLKLELDKFELFSTAEQRKVS